jgi:N-terminal half of MaoC dehydratase
MAEPPETLVTLAMRENQGVWKDEQISYPISLSDIRKFAIAVYWPETPPHLFWDEEYARTTRWGGIIAPQDFNPFAWPIKTVIPAERATPRGGGKGLRGMNGGQIDTYFVPMRPGDVIRARHRLRDWNERQTRLGQTLFYYTESEWWNQNDQLVKRHVQIFIRY